MTLSPPMRLDEKARMTPFSLRRCVWIEKAKNGPPSHIDGLDTAMALLD